MTDTTYEDIQKSRMQFGDIYTQSEDVLESISSMGGYQNITPAEDRQANGDVTLDASEAVAARDLQSNLALQSLIVKWQSRLASYTDKYESGSQGSGKEKRVLTGDERLTLMNRATELKLVLEDLGNLIAEANDFQFSTQDKLLGARAKSQPDPVTVQARANALEPTLSEKRDSADKDLMRLLRNTKESIAYLNEHPKTYLVE
jgi:hypothetical protein